MFGGLGFRAFSVWGFRAVVFGGLGFRALVFGGLEFRA